MKKTILMNGSFAGLILVASFIIAKFLGGWGAGNYGEVVGYATMVVALSFVFVGVRKIREDNDGKISFGKAFLYGLFISLIACGFYVFGWMIIDADGAFIAEYATNTMDKLRESGASEQELKETQEQMEYYKELYANPVTKAGVTLMEILPVGLIVPLITAAVLRKQ